MLKDRIWTQWKAAAGLVMERGFRTHQDRLVKGLRLAGLSDMDAAYRSELLTVNGKPPVEGSGIPRK